jgi:tRNA (guanine37-N1)-methyltransferase
MEIAVITPIPDVFTPFLESTIIRKSIVKKSLKLSIVDLREFGKGTYRQIDDTPYGGGGGMVMMAEPLKKSIVHAIGLMENSNDLEIIFPSPTGEIWSQKSASEMIEKKRLIIICGHYKGIDERIIKKYVTKEISVGNYVLSNGEVPAMVILDSLSRLIPGTLNNIDSALTDTHSYGLLDHPHYTKPKEFDNMIVPDILLSGNHENIKKWRQMKRETRTEQRNPKLWGEFLKLEKSEYGNG